MFLLESAEVHYERSILDKEVGGRAGPLVLKSPRAHLEGDLGNVSKQVVCGTSSDYTSELLRSPWSNVWTPTNLGDGLRYSIPTG